MNEDYIYRILDVTKKDLSNMMKGMIPTLFRAVDTWKKLGVESMYPTHNFPLHPFFRLSLGRSMIKFMEDLYYNPEKVERAMQVMTDELITDTIKGSKLFNVKLAMIVEERASTTFFPPKIFERFWWPYTKQLVEALYAEGIVTWFHLDTSWDDNFHYFKELPRGSAVLALDGTSDIFLAKKILGGHLCLAGDVQAVKLSIGTPKQVEDYCKKLIDVVGKDGGYILSSGCEIPEAVNPENLKAMIKTGREYELSKK